MRLASEDIMASEVGRLPGLESSHVMLDTLRGNDATMDFSEILNRASRRVRASRRRARRRARARLPPSPLAVPQDAPEVTKASLHDRAERLFGINDSNGFL